VSGLPTGATKLQNESHKKAFIFMNLTYPFEFYFSSCCVMMPNDIALNGNEKELPLQKKHYRQASKAISCHCKMRVI
jgi:hypothetical protein